MIARRATRASSRSSAPPPSRSRRSRSFGPERPDDRGARDRLRLAPREPEQLDAVRALLAKAPATEDELECGPEPARGSSTTAPASTPACSRSAGPRAGRAAATGSRPPGAAGLPGRDRGGGGRAPDELADRGRRLRRARRSRCRSSGWRSCSRGLEQVDGGAARRRRDAGAPGAHPRPSGGRHAADARAARAGPRRAAPRGCSARRARTASASRSRSRTAATRAHRGSALAELLRRLGIETGELGVVPLENSRGEVVGEIVVGAVRRAG